MKKSAKWTRLTEWEHWPTPVFYLPLLPFFFLRYLKAGHPNHYLAANPGIRYSGNGTESKHQSLNLIAEEFRPSSLLVEQGENPEEVLKKLEGLEIGFPLIAKPDQGFRGYLVKKLDSPSALHSYLKRVQTEVMIQEFVPFENELGIFYHRFPGQEKGKVTSVTIKKFMKIRGDGRECLEDLIKKDERAYLYLDIFRMIHKERMKKILDPGEELVLSVIGNHSKGTQFLNGNHLIDKRLHELMDRICIPMKGFHYGRLDIKFREYNTLLAGQDFKVLEVNGIISEPTHIYDASHEKASYLNALRTINRHWEIMSEIALINHRKHMVPYPGVREYIKNLRWLRRHSKMLKSLNAQVF
jgi:hypothetical protein